MKHVLKMANKVVKKHRVSKKNKKSWRKHVDIKDVEEYLEDVRLEERLGKPFSERLDDDLFEIDTKGEIENRRIEYLKGSRVLVSSDTENNSKFPKSLRLRNTETPRCFALLEERSAVRDPIVKRNRVRTKQERRHPLAKLKDAELQSKGILKAKELKAIRDRKLCEEKRKKSREPKEIFNKNVWTDVEDITSMDGNSYWLRKDTIRHNLVNTGHKMKKTPTSVLKKTSLVSPVEAPHPGVSYNPSLKDHRELLAKVIEKETSLIKSEEHLRRVTTNMFNKMSPAECENNWLQEMSGGLDMRDSGDESEGNEYKTVNPPTKNKKKTLQKRRRIQEALKLKEELKLKKIEKRKVADIYKLRKLNEVILKREKKLAGEKEKREKAKVEKKWKTKKLSKVKYEEPDEVFNMSQDLKGSLRGVEPEGNLLLDRYMSLQKRNILEPALKRKKPIVRVKKYEKKNHKMGWEPKGY